MLSKTVNDGSDPSPMSIGRPPPRPTTRWGRFMAIVHGDKYIVGAYPPEWQPRPPAVLATTALTPAHEPDTPVAPAGPPARSGSR